MTLLSAVNDAQREMSLEVTSDVVANGQETQNLLFRAAKRVATDIVTRADYDWPVLTRTKSFTASLASLQSSGKASDFKRALAGTFWNTSTHRPILGPLNAQEWATANGSAVSSSITQYVMFRYDGLHIYPTPTTADTISYDYINNTPVLDTDGVTYKTTFAADTDTYLLGDELLTLGVIWRYLQIKGRDYAEALKDYELALATEYASQRGAARVLQPAQCDDFDIGSHIPQLPAVLG